MFYALTYDEVHPEAALTLSITRSEAISIARSFIESEGQDLSSYRYALRFETDDSTKTFLEKEIGLDSANDLMGDEIRTWYWWVRWFIPEEEEEFGAGVDPSGRVVYYSHHIEENRAGADLAPSEAKQIATDFLDGLAHVNLNDYELISTSFSELPDRGQHNFVWKWKAFDFGEASYRISVKIDGDKVGYFSEYLHTPEVWDREESRKHAQRVLLVRLASFLEYGLGLAALVVLYRVHRAGQLRWRFALGLSGIVMGIQILLSLNALPGSWMGYSTNESIGSFYGDQALSLIRVLIFTPLTLFVLVAPAEALSRRVFPNHAPISSVFSKAFWLSRPTVTAVLIGVCLAAVHTGYYSLFYLVAQMFGAWAPFASPPFEGLSTPMPWVYPLASGFFAAINEEFTFRLFAVALLLRLTGKVTPSVVIPALIWGFLHSTYPQEPIWIRGLELTLVGIVMGLVLIRFGIVATIVSHYTYNALASGDFLIRSGQVGLAISGALVIGIILVPFLAALIWKMRGRSLATVEELHERERSVSRTSPNLKIARDTSPPYEGDRPLSPTVLRLCCLFALAGALIFLLVPRAQVFGHYAEVGVSHWEARKIATQFLEDRDIDLTGFRPTVDFDRGLNTSAANYMAHHVGIEELNELYQERFWHKPAWSVLFSKPLDEEQYAVNVRVDGTVVDFLHWLAEDAPGENLSESEAIELAEDYIRSLENVRLGDYELVENSSLKRSGRTDHWLAWEDRSEQIGEAHYRISLEIQGDEVNDFDHYLDIPDEWFRERNERGLKELMGSAVALILAVCVFAFALFLIVYVLRRRLLDFRAGFFCAIAVMASEAILGINALSSVWDGYETDSEPGVYLADTLFAWFATDMLETFAQVFFTIVFADAVFRLAFPRRYPLGYWLGLGDRADRDKQDRSRPRLRMAWSEAIVLAALLTCAVAGAGRLIDNAWWQDTDAILATSIHEDAPDASVLGGYTTFMPALGIAMNDFQASLGGVGVLMIIVGAFWKFARKVYWVGLLCALGGGAFAWSEATNWAEGAEFFAAGAFAFAVLFGVGLALVRWVYRGNLPAYFVSVLYVALAFEASEMLRVPNAFTRTNGAVLSLVLIGCTVLGAIVYIRDQARYVPDAIDNDESVKGSPVVR